MMHRWMFVTISHGLTGRTTSPKSNRSWGPEGAWRTGGPPSEIQEAQPVLVKYNPKSVIWYIHYTQWKIIVFLHLAFLILKKIAIECCNICKCNPMMIAMRGVRIFDIHWLWRHQTGAWAFFFIVGLNLCLTTATVACCAQDVVALFRPVSFSASAYWLSCIL